jgi:hypothetical protein
MKDKKMASKKRGLDDIVKPIKGELRLYVDKAVKSAYKAGNTKKARDNAVWWAKDAYKAKYGTTKGFSQAFEKAERELAAKRVASKAKTVKRTK